MKRLGMSAGVAKIAILLGSLGLATAWAVDLPTSETTVEVYVPANETQTVSRLSDYFSGTVTAGSNHYFNKTGDGTLILDGDVQYLNMNISNGVVRVARTDNAEALRYVHVSEGATLVFDQDNPIRDYGSITVWGTVDLNGHTDTFSTLYLVPPGRVIDTSGGQSTLTINSNFDPGESFLALKVKITKTSDGGDVTELDEFEPTYKGIPLISRSGGGIVVSGPPQNDLLWSHLCDKQLSQAVINWKLTTEAKLTFSSRSRVDGYRMVARNDNGKPTAPSPVSWEVYAQTDDDCWALVDKRDDVPFDETFFGKSFYLGQNFTFSRKAFIADNVAIVYGGSPYRSTTRSDKFGMMTFDSSREATKTEIKAGHTAVVASETGVYEAKWVRVRPTSTADVKNLADDYGYNWAVGSFKMVDENGTAFDATTANTWKTHSTGLHAFTAGSDSTRSIVGRDSTDCSVIRPVVLGFGGETKKIKGYQWRASLNSSDPNRKPTGFIIEVSTDDKAWNAEDKEWRLIDVCGYPIPDPDTGARDPRSFPAQLYRARYFRLEVCDTLTSEDKYIQFAELNLYRNGERVPWPEATTTATQTSTEDSSKIVDNVRELANKDSRDQRVLQDRMPYIVEIDAGETLAFDAFGYTSTGGGFFNRMPKSWRLMSRNSTSENWRTAQLHNGDVADFRQENYADQGPWPTWGYDVIGDAEAVIVNAGATLELNTAYEKFGTLNGAGALQLDDACAEIAVAGGDFAGKVTGSGTLVVSADQNFTDADLSGVSTLELAAGTMTGSASFGDKPLAIEFAGGALDATLSNLGSVTVSGEVKIAIPSKAEVGPKGSVKTLVADANLDDAAQTAFRNATFVSSDASRGVRATVEVTDTSVVLTARLTGFSVIVR